MTKIATITYDEKTILDDENVRLTSDGYIVASARVARTGIQLYCGSEVGMPDREVVRVYRPESAVFDKRSMSTFGHKPITYNHPSQGLVSPKTWKKDAIGHVDGEVARDGDCVRVPLLVCDGDAINAIQGGHRELSVGYTSKLEFVDGKTDSGEEYDAVQSDIRVNHVALVQKARGGSKLRIGDNETEGEDEMPENTTTKVTRTVNCDGISVVMGEQDAAIVERTMKKFTDDLAALTAVSTKYQTELNEAQKQIGTLTADAEKAKGEKVALEKQLKDAEVTDAALDARLTARFTLIDQAAKLVADKKVFDGKSNADIRRIAVTEKLGAEVAKSLTTDAAVEGAFAALVVAAGSSGNTRALADSFTKTQSFAAAGDDRAKAYEERSKYLADAWKNPGQPVDQGQRRPHS